MDVKVRLDEVDLKRIKRAEDICDKSFNYDQDAFIDVEELLDIIDTLNDRYMECWDLLQSIDTRTKDEYDWDLNFDRGFHPSEYE